MDLSAKNSTKTFRKSTGEHLQNAEQDKDSLYLTPKARSIKGKTDKLDLIVKFLSQNNSVKNRQATEQEKISANHIASKRLVVAGIHNNLSKQQLKKSSQG